MLQTSTITQKGQITIPALIREKLILKPGMKVTFRLEDKSITVSPLTSFFEFRGSVKSKKEYSIKKMREAVQKHLSKRHEKNT